MSVDLHIGLDLSQMPMPNIPIPTAVAYGVQPLLGDNAIAGEGSPEAQAQRMCARLHPSVLEPSLFGSAMFLGAVCDLVYCGDSRERSAAAALLDALAAAWGLGRERLEMLLVPSCGMAARDRLAGHRGRSYVLAVPESGPALLADVSGRKYTSFPHRMPQESRERWLCFRNQLGQKYHTQSRRLEQAMVVARRWPAAEFAELMLPHPLLRMLLSRLVCAGYDADGQLLQGFLVQENGDLVAETYGPFDLSRCSSVGIPHPADLSPERALVWAELLDDFQILPLFPQLRRPLFRPLAGERRAVTRFAGIRFNLSLFSTLDSLGWRAPLGATTATLELPGVPIQATLELRSERTWVTMEGCTFLAGGRPMHLGDVPTRFLSEAMWHLTKVSETPRLRAEA